MKHNEEFADFLRDHVNLNQGRIEELDQHVKAVTSYLRNNLAGFRRVEYQGSRALGTIIRPVKDRHEFDADLLVIVDKDGDAPKPYSDTLWDTLKDSDRYKEKIELWNRCVKVKYQGQCHLDMVPCVEDDGKQYVCPRNGDELEETDGTGFRDWFNDQNRITKGNLKRTVRLLKFIRDHKGNFSVPSVILTALAGDAIQAKDADGEEVSTMADTVATVLTRIDERLEKCDQIPVIDNPANPDLTFNTHWEDNQYQNFRRLMGVYANTARQARDETDKTKSIAAWQKLFGEDFKLRSNANAGQDRNTGPASGSGANAGARQRTTQASATSASVLVQPRKQYGGVLEGASNCVAVREVSPVDLEQLAERHPQLAYDAETNVLSGNLRVQASYRPGRGLNLNIPRRAGDRMYVEDNFAIEIQLTHNRPALAPWPPVYETGGRAQRIMEEQGVGIAGLHFFDERTDVNHCCLGLQNTDEWRGIIPFIDELVVPFFYRLAYAARYGVERAESDLWGTYHHRDGFEGAKRQYEAELRNYKKQNHGPNKPCPCRNGRKYRHCHKGEVDKLLAMPTG